MSWWDFLFGTGNTNKPVRAYIPEGFDYPPPPPPRGPISPGDSFEARLRMARDADADLLRLRIERLIEDRTDLYIYEAAKELKLPNVDHFYLHSPKVGCVPVPFPKSGFTCRMELEDLYCPRFFDVPGYVSPGDVGEASLGVASYTRCAEPTPVVVVVEQKARELKKKAEIAKRWPE